MENSEKQNRHFHMQTGKSINSHSKHPYNTIITNLKRNFSQRRSKLSTAAFIKWLRSRFHSTLPKRFPYLYFPHQLTKQASMEQIFVEFDSDGSGGLSRDEIHEMFRGFGIDITIEHLNELYDSVEVNLEELDCEKFKKCALSQKSNKVFRQIVHQMQFDIGTMSQKQKKYLPHNFTNMIIYLVYLSKRHELKTQIQENKIPIKQKVQSMENLLKLRDLSLNNERLSLFTENMKNNLKNKFRDIWERVNQKYAQKFPMTSKLQEEFYKYYLKSQASANTNKWIQSSKKNLQKQPGSKLSMKKF